MNECQRGKCVWIQEEKAQRPLRLATSLSKRISSTTKGLLHWRLKQSIIVMGVSYLTCFSIDTQGDDCGKAGPKDVGAIQTLSTLIELTNLFFVYPFSSSLPPPLPSFLSSIT